MMMRLEMMRADFITRNGVEPKTVTMSKESHLELTIELVKMGGLPTIPYPAKVIGMEIIIDTEYKGKLVALS